MRGFYGRVAALRVLARAAGLARYDRKRIVTG